MFCDLHIHSTASDGTVEPEHLGQLAARADLAAIALTDHDTLSGLAACRTGCDEHGVELVSGVEISCEPPMRGATLHLLGYFVEPGVEALDSLLAEQESARSRRIPEIVSKLNDLGIELTLEQVQQQAKGAMLGRPHVGRALVELGYARSVQDAFIKYLGSSGQAYVPKAKSEPGLAIEAIHAAGGLACLAHPVQLKLDDESLAQFVKQLADMGLDGIEVYHSEHEHEAVRLYQDLARRLDLLISGGSDFHGLGRDATLGQPRVPIEVLDRLREALADRSLR